MSDVSVMVLVTQLNVLQAAVQCLFATHPQPELLRKQFSENVEGLRAKWLPSVATDADIQSANEMASAFLSSLQRRT